jgi:hypothetical protein
MNVGQIFYLNPAPFDCLLIRAVAASDNGWV